MSYVSLSFCLKDMTVMRDKQTQSNTQTPLTGKGQVTKTLLFFCAVIAVFATVIILTSSGSVSVSHKGELSGFNYSSKIACISPDCFDCYPGALYTPDDFASGHAAEPPGKDDGSAEYYTSTALCWSLRKARYTASPATARPMRKHCGWTACCFPRWENRATAWKP